LIIIIIIIIIYKDLILIRYLTIKIKFIIDLFIILIFETYF